MNSLLKKNNALKSTTFSFEKHTSKKANLRTPQASLHCCVIHTTLKKNNKNIFVNVTNTEGQTIIKFTAGSIRGGTNSAPMGKANRASSNSLPFLSRRVNTQTSRKGKKQPRTAARWIIEKISYFIRNNFDCVKIIVKGYTPKSLPYLRELKRQGKKLTVVYFQNRVPIPHNGCRPPRKRRI
uniref:30S ribosomal protein S11 n=1 Tax=Marophrys sp. SRT127 TaxID=2488311 RepID=A0A455RE39_9EUKA|nr:30S ribosomal protein S11 [Marophrys sp. SRT127]